MTTSTPTLISSAPELQAFLSSITPSSTLYLDLEGSNLSRHGTISLITVLLHPQKLVRLIDVVVLGKAAFNTPSSSGKTLKSIFEDPNIGKSVWDVRNDADALWALYHVGLAGVTDIQLLENASRAGNKTYISGLDRAIQSDLKLGFMELNRWLRTKKDVKNLMPTDIFSTRPLDDKTVQYCANDVLHLPDLHAFYLKRIKGDWSAKVMEESALRVSQAHSPAYEPQSPTKKLGPWGSGINEQIPTLDEMLEEMREKELEEDDVGYHDYDPYDDSGTCAADGATCPEFFDSCWDRNS